LLSTIIDITLLTSKPLIFGGHYEVTEWNTVSQLEIYPYTGGHTQAAYPEGPNVKTGDHGFMVDFDLDRPPRKRRMSFG
jgi:hypothetical protein